LNGIVLLELLQAVNDLGSAIPHHYDLVLGSHSVHTSAEALREAEGRISTIQTGLVQQGRL
jgi:hypothetical protein